MDAAESLRLLSSGQKKWNSWAAKRLAEREELLANGQWIESQPAWNEETRRWHARADVDLSNHPFGTLPSFSQLIFPGDARFAGTNFGSEARFVGTRFQGAANFAGAQFHGPAQFEGAGFGDRVSFENVRFADDASFTGTKFASIARFSGSKFEKSSYFGEAVFSQRTDFSKVRFTKSATFGGVVFNGDALFSLSNFQSLASYEGATFGKNADFTEANFHGLSRFDGAAFLGAAQFWSVTFERDARFNGAKFSGTPGHSDGAHFGRAVFKEFARFDDAVFDGGAHFAGAIFVGAAWLPGVQFGGEGDFLQTAFEGFAKFDRARFCQQANFYAIKSDSVFSLAGAEFLAVPNFVQAHFVEAPRFDNLRISETLQTTNDSDLAAKWRALKRLAIQGHDHAREQAYFRGELKARRWSEDKPWQGVFIFGLMYEALSDFGRSLWRPICWWICSVLVFSFLYLCQHPSLATGEMSIVAGIRQLAHPDPTSPALSCVAGQGDVASAAFLLSLQKGLLVFGPVPVKKAEELHSCLYGTRAGAVNEAKNLSATSPPIVPDSVVALGFVQYPLSAVLVFLLLLSIRNHFRIR